MVDEPSTEHDAVLASSRRRRSGTAVEIAQGPADLRETDDPVSRERALILTAAESRYHREERLDVAQTRLWGLVALVVGLAGSGAALLSVTSDTVKVVVPIAAAIVGVLAGVAAAYAPHGTLRRWLLRGARGDQPAPPDSLARIGDALEDQRRDARRSAITVWRGA